MTSAQVEKLQDDIYRKMSPAKKLKILGDFFILGKKFDLLKYGNRKTRKTFALNRKNFI